MLLIHLIDNGNQILSKFLRECTHALYLFIAVYGPLHIMFLDTNGSIKGSGKYPTFSTIQEDIMFFPHFRFLNQFHVPIHHIPMVPSLCLEEGKFPMMANEFASLLGLQVRCCLQVPYCHV